MIAYLMRVWACRYFWLSLVQIDLRGRYRRSLLGVGWSLLRPAAFTAILCVVFQRLLRPTDVWEYAPYLLSGLTLWDFITTATKQGCQCFFQGESYIRQHPSPIAIFPLRTALAESFHFLVGLSVLLILSLGLKGPAVMAAWPALVPACVLLFVVAWSLALLAGMMNVFFQDTQHLCDVGFQVFFYATPIIYQPDMLGTGRLGWLITHCNPLVPFLDMLREPLLHGRPAAAGTYLTAALVTAVLAGAASLACARLQKRIIFHL
ncbi:MAG: ABC transporter permease [Gemmataceae bacterium]